MRNLLILTLLLATSFPLSAQKFFPKTDLELGQINGKVQREVFIKYEIDLKNEFQYVYTDSNDYNKSGNLLHEQCYNADSSRNYRQVYEYDPGGKNLIHFRSYDYPELLSEETFSEYDSAGNEIKFIQKYYYEEDTTITIYLYKYNSVHKLTETNRVNIFDGVRSKEYLETLNTYTNNNKQKASQSWDEERKINSSILEEYDTSGRILKSNNLLTKQETRYKYDKKGNIASVKILNESGRMTYTSIYSYDSHNNRRKHLELDSSSKIVLNLAYNYEQFDKKNNWQKMYFLRDGKVMGYALRKFSYYEWG